MSYPVYGNDQCSSPKADYPSKSSDEEGRTSSAPRSRRSTIPDSQEVKSTSRERYYRGSGVPNQAPASDEMVNEGPEGHRGDPAPSDYLQYSSSFEDVPSSDTKVWKRNSMGLPNSHFNVGDTNEVKKVLDDDGSATKTSHNPDEDPHMPYADHDSVEDTPVPDAPGLYESRE